MTDEPDRLDAESRWDSPERDLPQVPRCRPARATSDPTRSRCFRIGVVFADVDVAVFGVSPGTMPWFFGGRTLLVGLLRLATVLASLRQSTSTARSRAETPDGDANHGTDGDGHAADAPTSPAAEETTEGEDASRTPDEATPDAAERNG